MRFLKFEVKQIGIYVVLCTKESVVCVSGKVYTKVDCAEKLWKRIGIFALKQVTNEYKIKKKIYLGRL